MGAEGRYDLQLADNETAAATPLEEGLSAVQNEQQQQEVWVKCTRTHTRTLKHVHSGTHMHAHTQAYTHTYMHAHTHCVAKFHHFT